MNPFILWSYQKWALHFSTSLKFLFLVKSPNSSMITQKRIKPQYWFCSDRHRNNVLIMDRTGLSAAAVRRNRWEPFSSPISMVPPVPCRLCYHLAALPTVCCSTLQLLISKSTAQSLRLVCSVEEFEIYPSCFRGLILPTGKTFLIQNLP